MELVEDTGEVALVEIPRKIPGEELESDRDKRETDDVVAGKPSEPSLCQHMKHVRDRFDSSSVMVARVTNGKTTGVEKTGVMSDEESEYNPDEESNWDPKQNSHTGTISDSDSKVDSNNSDLESNSKDSPDGGSSTVSYTP